VEGIHKLWNATVMHVVGFSTMKMHNFDLRIGVEGPRIGQLCVEVKEKLGIYNWDRLLFSPVN
jgi:hypothetical protein